MGLQREITALGIRLEPVFLMLRMLRQHLAASLRNPPLVVVATMLPDRNRAIRTCGRQAQNAVGRKSQYHAVGPSSAWWAGVSAELNLFWVVPAGPTFAWSTLVW